MKLTNYLKIGALCAVLFSLFAIACKTGGAQSPTDAYRMLYKAVQSKNTEEIKKMMSQSTLKFVEGVAAQQNKPVEKVLENGLFASTINPEMPEIRDERVKDDKWGAVEVFVKNAGNWEQAYFVKEEDGWKVAVGDLFAGTYQNPGKSKAQEEAEASNTNNMIPYSPNINGNFPSGKKSPGSSDVNTAMVKPEKPADPKAAPK